MPPPSHAATSAPVAQPRLKVFADLFDQEFSYIWKTLRGLGVHHRDLEDVTHEVFLVVHRSLDKYDPARPLRPWLFGFAHRIASDYRRLARHRMELIGDVAELDGPHCVTDSPQDAAVASREAASIVNRALDQIDFDQRAVFVLHDIEGQPMKIVAETLSINVNTAYSRLRLGRARFAAIVRAMSASTSVDCESVDCEREEP